jgi:hypothetical protein
MNVTAAQIEQIVRVVLQRLRSDAAALQSPTLAFSSQSTVAEANADVLQPNPGELVVTERVVTLDTLKGRLDGTLAIVVHPKAVVTPAVRDELRARNVRLVRQLSSGDNRNARRAPLLLITAHQQIALLGKRVCPQQSQSLAIEDVNAALAAIVGHLSGGGVGAVWCSDSPFAAVAATLGQSQLRAVQLPELRDLAQAIDQAKPNVIVIDKRVWSEAAIANLIRNWYRSSR